VRAEQLAPYVVVTGIRMPGMDGIEATRRITAGSATPPKVLILTTCDDEYLYDALRAGASGLLVKDMDTGTKSSPRSRSSPRVMPSSY
jgi:DNA-binding NarL/FixJ family response regulator